jgi:RNA polymerase sigma factor (sigma-70 family)
LKGAHLAALEIFGALIRLQGYMEHAALSGTLTAEQDQRITETVERERARLRNFIRRRVADAADADDVLQEVFYELVEAYRLMQPLEQVSAWLFRVARNRITDLFRKKKPAGVRERSDRVRGRRRAVLVRGFVAVSGCRARSALRAECFARRVRERRG